MGLQKTELKKWFKDIGTYVKKLKDSLKTFAQDPLYDKPTLAIFQVGNVEASNRYVKNKIKDCEEIGIKGEWYHFPAEITTEELEFEIKAMAPFGDGLIVQLPLPAHIDVERIKLAIPPEIDVDGFHPMSEFEPCTPKGIMMFLEDCGFPLEGAHVAIIGRSEIVGKPLAKMMTDANATVTLCHSKTKDLDKVLDMADLIVCAVGKTGFLDASKRETPIIDVGINFDKNGKLCGDCYNTEEACVTPVPGGVGLLTRAALMTNVLISVRKKKIRELGDK